MFVFASFTCFTVSKPPASPAPASAPEPAPVQSSASAPADPAPAPISISVVPAPSSSASSAVTMSSASSPAKAKILVVYYSMYGHIATMADKVIEGIKATGAEVTVRQIPETLPAEVLAKMHAPPKRESVPVVTHDDLIAADGIFFGFPTRYGMVPAQVKAFWDSTGQLWSKGSLVGKMAATFFSTATQGGGQETTALTFVTQLVHHGIIYVPLGYSCPLLFNLDEVHGGSPYGTQFNDTNTYAHAHIR